MTAKFLVVEDSTAMRALVVAIIESLGFSVLQAGSGEEALELFVSELIDLVVLDVELPGINGFDTCRKMRELRAHDWFPVIYMSASGTDDYIIRGLDAGGDAYISKPVNARLLESIVNAMGRITAIKQELALANRTLQNLANYDGLTKILNRRGFDESFQRYWKQAQRANTQMTVILMDVDHFKLYNDNYGHLKGDDCLTKVAAELENGLMRPIDLVARYGGEEFVVLLPETPLVNADAVAERLLNKIRELAEPHDFSDAAHCVTLSAGVAGNLGMVTPEAMLQAADTALYQAKESGRNRFCIAPVPG